MEYYSVNVNATRVNGTDYTQKIFFKSSFAAVYMARKYYACEDVNFVDVVDETTGEVVFSKDNNAEYISSTLTKSEDFQEQ